MRYYGMKATPSRFARAPPAAANPVPEESPYIRDFTCEPYSCINLPSLPSSIRSLSGRICASQTGHCFPGLTMVSAQVEHTTCPQMTSSLSFLSFFAFFDGPGPSVACSCGARFDVNNIDLVAFDISREHEGHIGVDFVVSVLDAAG